MDSETTPSTSKDGESHDSGSVSEKQKTIAQSTSKTPPKLRDLKVVLFKLNVGKCFPLPGKIGFSTEYPITAINFGKHQVPGPRGTSERKTKRVLEQAPCCLTCVEGNTCTKRAKQSGKGVEQPRKKRKYVRRKKPQSGEKQSKKDFLPTMCQMSTLEAQLDKWADQDRISSLFLGRGLPHSSLNTVGRGQTSGPVSTPRFPWSRNQATVTNSDTVHVVFSREKLLGQTSSHLDTSTWALDISQGYPSTATWATQFIPNFPVSLAGVPDLTVHTGVPSPVNPVNPVLQQRPTVGVPVYAPAPYPVFLHPGAQQSGINQFVPVFEGASGAPVYVSVPPAIPQPAATNLRQGVATCSSTAGGGSRFIRSAPIHKGHSSSIASSQPLTQPTRAHASTSNLAQQSINLSEVTNRHLQPQPTGHVQLDSRLQAETTQSKINGACLQMAITLKQVLRDKRLGGNYGFLVDHYRSILEQAPTSTLAITEENSLLHFLKLAESQFRLEFLELEKKCLNSQTLTEKYQRDILKEGEKYKQVTRKKVAAEENLAAIEEMIRQGHCNKRSFKAMDTEIKDLEAKLEELKSERDSLQEKWSNYEKRLPQTALKKS